MRTVLPPKARLVPPNAKRVFKGIIFDVYHWQQPAFDGAPITFEMLKRPDSVVIIAVKDGKLVLGEERHAEIPEPFLGFPGGRHDRAEETELQAAQREMREETGLTFKSWKLLDIRQVESKIEHFVYYFLAWDFEREVPTQLDASEQVSVKLLSMEEVKNMPPAFRTRSVKQLVLSRANSVDELLALPEYRP
jgi:8-oxo-dGTP pyrophosphatase MutT (NUDIX family)